MTEDNLEKSRKIARLVHKREKLEVPVNIEKLIKKYAKIEPADIPFGDAICINNESDTRIIYNSNNIDTRIRFTLAHELGHIKIPWHTGMISCDTKDDRIEYIEKNKYRQIEVEANIFASELLIPTEWLKKIVKEQIKYGINYLINKISQEAKVSLSAALYALANLLPYGYVLIIDKVDYKQKFFNSELDIFFLYKNHEIYKKWLSINSKGIESIDIPYNTITCFNLGELLPDYDISESVGIESFFKYVFEKQEKSPAIIIPYISKKLPSGYIFKVSLENDTISNIIKSEGTYIKVNEKDYDYYCIDNGLYIHSLFKIYWWRFDIKEYSDKNIHEQKDSKEVLREIVERNYFEKHEKTSIFAKVNGVIGSLNSQYKNNRIRIRDKEEFYSILHQRFLGREDLHVILEDDNFDLYLYKKASEIFD